MGGREAFEFVWNEEAIRFFWHAQPVREWGFFTDKRVEVFLRLFRWFAPKAPARVLEVGAGSGAFLARLREEGWRELMVDVSGCLAAEGQDRGVAKKSGQSISRQTAWMARTRHLPRRGWGLVPGWPACDPLSLGRSGLGSRSSARMGCGSPSSFFLRL